MPGDADHTDGRVSCTVCHVLLYNIQSLQKHMQVKHPTEWVNSQAGTPITYHPCDVFGCNKLANNTRIEYKVEHLSRIHGIDSPSMLRTTLGWYLRLKNKAVLQMHVAQEARELNELNTKIRNLEYCLVVDNSGTAYMSCHGLDVWTEWRTDLANQPWRKPDLVTYLQGIRNCRNELGPLHTRPGVMDTRDGILDDLEKMLDTPQSVVVKDLEEQLDARDDALDFLEMLLDTSDCGDEDAEMMLDSLDDLPDPDNLESLFDPYNLDPDAFQGLDTFDEDLEVLAALLP